MTRKDSARQKQRTKSLWDNNEIQFARLLCEMAHAVSSNQWLALVKDVADSMSLTEAQVEELFGRANTVWEKAKKENCP